MQVWYTILHEQCIPSLISSTTALGQSRLVLDVGSNFGYYSLYAAAHGCRWAIGASDYPGCTLLCCTTALLSGLLPAAISGCCLQIATAGVGLPVQGGCLGACAKVQALHRIWAAGQSVPASGACAAQCGRRSQRRLVHPQGAPAGDLGHCINRRRQHRSVSFC